MVEESCMYNILYALRKLLITVGHNVSVSSLPLHPPSPHKNLPCRFATTLHKPVYFAVNSELAHSTPRHPRQLAIWIRKEGVQKLCTEYFFGRKGIFAHAGGGGGWKATMLVLIREADCFLAIFSLLKSEEFAIIQR